MSQSFGLRHRTTSVIAISEREILVCRKASERKLPNWECGRDGRDSRTSFSPGASPTSKSLVDSYLPPISNSVNPDPVLANAQPLDSQRLPFPTTILPIALPLPAQIPDEEFGGVEI